MHLKMFYFENKCSTFSSVLFWQRQQTDIKMPRSRAMRDLSHDRLRQTLAFFLNHVLVNHVAGIDMGVLVHQFIIDKLKVIREVVEMEVQELLIEEEEGFEEDSSSSEDEPPQEVEP